MGLTGLLEEHPALFPSNTTVHDSLGYQPPHSLGHHPKFILNREGSPAKVPPESWGSQKRRLCVVQNQQANPRGTPREVLAGLAVPTSPWSSTNSSSP